ncbi:MAG: protein kinase [Pyrinomonadaceae bacterium]
MPNIGEIIDKYKILSVLGAGGMGQVFLAEDTLLGRKAALKFLSAGSAGDPELRDRFIREARAASSLSHPNICTIYEIRDHPDEPYLAMEFAEGETLAALIRSRRRSSWQAVDVAIQVAEALSEAHRIGIVHRDIKPANIIVDARGRVKVLDFGLAKRMSGLAGDAGSQFETSPGVVLGTASYMSPEQARGLPVDHRSDIWSLGVCLFEMLTGTSPFAGETAADTFAAVLRGEPLPPSALIDGVPDDLGDLVLECIRKPPDERVRSADDLVRRLRLIANRISSGSDAAFSAQADARHDEPTEVFDAAADTVISSGASLRLETPTNLTSFQSRMVGREAEIGAVTGMLRDPAVRLITLTGIGGTGKTTLARAAARELLGEFPDGVYFVEMADVVNPNLVLPSIAQPLGIKDDGGSAQADVLKEFLAGKRILIIIDNFEQVIDAAPRIAELLASAPGLKLMVTSREVLRLSAETEFQVPALALPENADVPAEDLIRAEAVVLFAERARSARPAFALSDENISEVAAVCRRLDGLPLAIELAAARVKVLSPAAILEKLERGLDLLTGGARDLPERQRTMRGAVRWSYGLLSDDEKAVFRMLAVFSGGFRLAAAEAVCRTGSNGGTEMADLIASLIDKSLLVRREVRGGEPRFRMLEVVRDLALEMLQAAGEESAARRRHAEYFVALGEQAEPHLQTADSGVWLAQLEEDHDNIRAAMRWSLENDHPLAVRLAVSVRNFWLVHSHLREGFEWLQAVASLETEPDQALQFKLLNGLGLAARFLGDLTTARSAYERGLAAGTAAGNLQGTALSNRGLGLVAMQQGDLAAAGRYFDAGLAISRQIEDKYGIAMSLAFIGDLARTEGRFADSIGPFTEAVGLFRELENKTATSDVLNNLGAALVCVGEPRTAAPYFREALETAHSLSNRITTSCSLDGFAAIAVLDGDLEKAAILFGAADQIRSEIGYEIEPAEAGFRDRFTSLLREEMPAEEIEAAWEKGRKLQLEEAIASALAVSENARVAEANQP